MAEFRTLTAVLPCPGCGQDADCLWIDPEGQDAVEAPSGEQRCACGHTWVAEYPGWSFFTEA